MVFIEKVLFRLNVALFPILNSVHSPNLPVSFSFPSNSLIYIHLSLSFIFPTHWKPKSHVPSCVAGVAVALRGYCQTIFRGVFCPESPRQKRSNFYSSRAALKVQALERKRSYSALLHKFAQRIGSRAKRALLWCTRACTFKSAGTGAKTILELAIGYCI